MSWRKNLEEVISQGVFGKLTSVPAGEAVAVSAAPDSAAPEALSHPLLPHSTPAPAAGKKDQKEDSEESDRGTQFGFKNN